MDAERLGRLAIFAELDDGERYAVATWAQEKSAARGQVLMREGDFSYALVAIEHGTAHVERDGRRLAELGPGDLFGEIGTLRAGLDGAALVADSPMLLVALSRFDGAAAGPSPVARLPGGWRGALAGGLCRRAVWLGGATRGAVPMRVPPGRGDGQGDPADRPERHKQPPRVPRGLRT